jgi:hypothetical protein
MGSTIVVEFAPRTRTSRTGEPRRNANTGECLGYRREGRHGGCQQNRAVESSRLKGWLPGMDSNHDSRLQRPLSYH